MIEIVEINIGLNDESSEAIEALRDLFKANLYDEEGIKAKLKTYVHDRLWSRHVEELTEAVQNMIQEHEDLREVMKSSYFSGVNDTLKMILHVLAEISLFDKKE